VLINVYKTLFKYLKRREDLEITPLNTAMALAYTFTTTGY